MRSLLKRRPKTKAVTAGPHPAATCGLLTCPHCGLRLETPAFRCPRCLEDIPLGCGGNCRECGKASR